MLLYVHTPWEREAPQTSRQTLPNDSYDKESNAGRQWIFRQLLPSAKVGCNAQSHHICPPHPLHSAHAWDTRPASPCKAVYSVHQAATPIFFHPLINLKKYLLTNIYTVHLSTTLHTGGSAKQGLI